MSIARQPTVIYTCECRKTAEVESGVASAGVAAMVSRNSKRDSGGFLGQRAEREALRNLSFAESG
jgi:hypothetical protein